jgi:putative endonuclease
MKLYLPPLSKATGALAQLVEQRTENPCVPGSIPGGTTLKPRTFSLGFFNLGPMHYLYILYSEKSDKYYTGETPNLNSRLDLHNTHHFKNAFTKSANDWMIKLTFNTEYKEDAVFLEGFIKRMKSRKFIEKVIKNPIILEQILSEKS